MWNWGEGGGPIAAIIVGTALALLSGFTVGMLFTSPVEWILNRTKKEEHSYPQPTYLRRWENGRMLFGVAVAIAWAVLMWLAIFGTGPLDERDLGFFIWAPLMGPVLIAIAIGVVLSPFIAIWWLIQKARGQ